MLGTPRILRYECLNGDRDNAPGADNQQERLAAPKASRILRGHTPDTGQKDPVKRWSDLHGDVQSQADQEMTWPLAAAAVSGNNSVGPYPMQP